MMQNVIPWIGICAAALTSLAYIPQVLKAWPRGSNSDLSLKMLLALTAGLTLWIVYGFLKNDWVIVVWPTASEQRSPPAFYSSKSATYVRSGPKLSFSISDFTTTSRWSGYGT
jgi:MtN3 and saliva related transmembrane protein